MRHRKSFNHLGRTSSHRSAMLANMAAALILNKRIETTTAKAKALRGYVEPLITKSKDDTTHSRRIVFSYLQNKEAVAELFREVAAKVHDRPGGYTRVLKLGTRPGDSAEMCIIELVDFNENLLGESVTKTKTGRRRRGGKKKDQDKLSPATVSVTPEKEEITESVKPADEDAESVKPADEGDGSVKPADEGDGSVVTSDADAESVDNANVETTVSESVDTIENEVPEEVEEQEVISGKEESVSEDERDIPEETEDKEKGKEKN